jgi:hypothetical protein
MLEVTPHCATAQWELASRERGISRHKFWIPGSMLRIAPE